VRPRRFAAPTEVSPIACTSASRTAWANSGRSSRSDRGTRNCELTRQTLQRGRAGMHEAERYADVRITEPGAACGGRAADPYGAIQSFVDVQGRSTKSAPKAPAWCTPSTTQSRPGERAPILRSPIRAFPLTVCEYRTPPTAGHSPSAMATVCTVQGAAGDREGQR
jgi:hypothetical protein